MKAAILVESKKDLIIDDIQLQNPLDYGQVLVNVRYTTICGSQLGEIDAVKGPDKFLPHLLGHEGYGIVNEIGPGVKNFKSGDEVVLHWRKGNGIDSACPTYKWGNKIVNAGWVTTFNEQAVVSENRITKLPKNIDPKLAPLYGCAITTGFGVVSNDAKMKIGESILIFGVGGVGLPIICAAKLNSASNIVAIDLDDNKLNLALKLGANQAIKPNEGIEEFLLTLFPEKFDITVDCTGLKNVMTTCYNLTKNDGRTILVGVPNKDNPLCIDSLPLHFEKSITGSHGGNTHPTKDIPRISKVFNTNNLQQMISHEYVLDDINDGIKVMRTGSAIKCLVKL